MGLTDWSDLSGEGMDSGSGGGDDRVVGVEVVMGYVDLGKGV